MCWQLAGVSYSQRASLPMGRSALRPQVQIEPHRGRHAAAQLPGQVGPKYTGILQALQTIVREEGIRVPPPPPFPPPSPPQPPPDTPPTSQSN